MDEQPGFRVPEAVATLIFDQPPLTGARVEARLRLSPTQYHTIKDVMERRFAPETTIDQMVDLSHEAAVLFAPALISWNLVDPVTGEPVPATLAGLDTLDIRITGPMIATWIGWLGRAPLPLPETSPEPTALPTGRNRKQRRSTAGGQTAGGSRPKSTRSRTSSPSSACSA